MFTYCQRSKRAVSWLSDVCISNRMYRSVISTEQVTADNHINYYGKYREMFKFFLCGSRGSFRISAAFVVDLCRYQHQSLLIKPTDVIILLIRGDCQHCSQIV